MGYKRGVPESGAPPVRRPNGKRRKPEETGPARRLEGAEAKPEGALRVLKRRGAGPGPSESSYGCRNKQTEKIKK